MHPLVIRAACWLAALALAVAGCAAGHSFLVIPGKSFGPIRESTSRSDLVRLFGAGSVEDGELPFPEAACTFGSVIYADTKNAIEIGWQDQARTRVAFVRTRTGADGQWSTPKGVRVGSTLRQLIRLAGKPVTFSGFGWDYAGQMTWRERGGSLERLLRSHMDRLPDAAMGDKPVRSDLPGLNPDQFDVAGLQQVWRDAWEYHDCHY